MAGIEARSVQGMVRRIAAILLLGPPLDANYAATKAAPHPWPNSGAHHSEDTV